jgi:HlyD family secretion protein
MANGKKKKSKKKVVIFGGIGVLVLALVLIALLGGSKDEIIAVQIEKVEKRTITQTVAATGKINPEFKVPITSEVTGEIVDLPVKEGDRVKKGQLLIKIKGDAYVAQQERAAANLQAARANLQMRQAEVDKVTLDFNRLKELHSKNLASDSELETIQSSYLTTKALYESAEANVLQSEASLREIIEQVKKTTIYSPIDGVVTKLNIELGERVLGSGYSMGTDIMTVSDLTNIEATVEVDENDVVLISVGDTSRIKVDAFRDREFNGVVTQIGNSAITSGLGTQEQVVNFEVRIKLLEPDIALRPGMSCNADIETETVSDVISVPIQSVTARTEMPNKTENEEEDENKNVKPAGNRGKQNKLQEIVFIVENGKAKLVNVETGISNDNYLEIKSGLEGSEEVVSGSYRAISRELNDGSVVRVEGQNMQASNN